nr:uncharacterized protein LOC131786245 [Pocillopora verrucosa]
METEREWHFVKNLTKKQTKTRQGKYWFIGLKRFDGSRAWSWLNKTIAWVNGTSAGTWRWNKGEPNNLEKEKCGEMWSNGKYNNIPCEAASYYKNPGYICEKQFYCSTISNNSENDDIFIESTTRPLSTPQPLATKTTSNSLRTQLSKTQNKLLTEGTTFENTVRESSPQNGSTRGPNLMLIVIVLLAIFILAIAVVFGISFFRRHQDQLHDRFNCTYEVPQSSELQSIDPVLGQQTQRSAEVTVHLTLSQTESGPATYEAASDCKRECEHDHIDETNRKSRSLTEGYSDFQEKKVGNEKGIQQPPSLCDIKEEEKDYVYAVVHKERKRGARLDNNTEAAESETPQAGGNSEYLYAAVDKTKKEKPPQKPPPYRGHVYADLVHSREISAMFVKEHSQTVYVQFDHA